jgi:LmbE family N-acetylglucosaminyl deacetylase
MKKNIKWKKLKIFIIILFLFILIFQNDSKNIVFLIGNSVQIQKYWVGGKYEIFKKNYLDNNNEKIYLKSLYNKTVELSNGFILMKSSGRECLTAYTKNKKINIKICINIYNTPKLNFKETNPIKLEIYNSMRLHLYRRDYPKINIKYKSNHPEIIKVNNEGEIIAVRPGSAIITASGLDGKNTNIKIFAISNNGFISNFTLNQYNASQYKKLMIVAHPDDETLWGGANLFKDRYFVVCLTNGFNLKRANDFKELLKFTNNSGIILNYPDLQDNIRDDWSEVRIGILKDLSKLLNYQYWDKIVTHGPDGTTGHIHHKKTCKYVTQIVKKYNEYDNLYYFGKFYTKTKLPKYLPKISDEELTYKKKEIHIYKSVIKNIFKFWYHMLPYENWILASKWKK